jgi:type I restriction enzyme S subunit
MAQNNWRLWELDDLFTFDGGYGVPRGQLGDIGIPYLHYGDVHISNALEIDFDKNKNILPRYNIKQSGKAQLNNGDLVFVDASEDYAGTCKTFLVINKNNKPFVAGLHTFIAREKRKVICDDFKKYLTQIPQVKDGIFRLTQGYKVYGINRNNLRKIEVLLPSYNESIAISAVLTAFQNAITLRTNLIAKLKLRKKALMQKLLAPQDDWREVKLNELINKGIIKLSRGSVISAKDIANKEGSYPVYSSSIINLGKMGCYGNYMFDEEKITWSIDGGGNFFYRPKHKFSVTNVCGYMNIKKNFFNTYYLATWLQSQHEKQFFNYISKAHPSIIKTLYTICYPKLRKQKHIASILQNADSQISLHEKLLEQEKLRFKFLLENLLTAKIRLPQFIRGERGVK